MFRRPIRVYSRAFAVDLNSHLSAYAAEYVALARRLGVTLVTTDRQVLEHSPNLAVRLQEFARPAA